MYADQISTAASAPSTTASTPTPPPAAARANGPTESKRQRQTDDKWKHDLYREDDEPTSKSIDPRDLRLKLQKKSFQHGYAGQKGSGVRDLREMLSGTMHAQPPNVDRPKIKPSSRVVKPPKYEPANEMHVPQSKKVPKPTSSKKTSQPKAESSVDSFLRSLGLEKYSITFQAEEVDMAALRHMTDDDLKALGIPMGPRKKIFFPWNQEHMLVAIEYNVERREILCSSASLTSSDVWHLSL